MPKRKTHVLNCGAQSRNMVELCIFNNSPRAATNSRGLSNLKGQATMSDSTSTPIKVCKTCGKEFPATREYFHPGSYPDNLLPDCKQCRNHYRRTDPKYKEKDRARRKKWKANNPHSGAEYQRRFREKYPERTANQRQKRIDRDLSILSYFPPEHWSFCLNYWGGCCAYCGQPAGLWNRISRDHFVPVSDPSCLGTVIVNILPACRDCNSKKNSMDASEWVIKNFGPEKGKDILGSIREYFLVVRRTYGTPKVIFELDV